MCRSSVLWRCAAGGALVVSVAACSGGGEALRTTPPLPASTVPGSTVPASTVPVSSTSTGDLNRELSTLDQKLAELDQSLRQIDAALGTDEGDPTK